MIPSTAQYKSAIHAPHKQRTDIDVLNAAGTILAMRLPIISGSVQAVMTNRVTRTAIVDLPFEFFPWEPDDLLAPESAFLRIRTGIEYPDGSTEVFPVFFGRVTDVTLDDQGGVSILGEDRAAEVVAFRFEQPRNSTEGMPITLQIQQLISEAVPGAVFGVNDVVDSPTPQLTWDEDRGRAVDDLSNALGARWYALGDGSFVVRQFPYDNGIVAQTFAEGSGGLLEGAAVSKTRNGTANSVTVVSERTDGTEPVRVTSRDQDAGSPTFFGDAFGRVSQIIKIQTPLTSNEAQRLANAQLNAATALSEQWNVTCTADHTIEPGDAVRITSRGHTTVQVVDTVTYPLTPGPMTFSTRMFSIPPITLSV